MAELLQNEEVLRLLELSKNGLLFAIWETMYVTVIATFFSYVIGLPLGVITVVGEPGGVLPLPRPVMTVLNFVINILRSVPFLILMVVVIPVSRFFVGTSIGTTATIVPLIVAAFPFVARLVESSLREVDSGVYYHPQLRCHGWRHRRRRLGLYVPDAGLPAPDEDHPVGVRGGAGNPGADLPVHRLPGCRAL